MHNGALRDIKVITVAVRVGNVPLFGNAGITVYIVGTQIYKLSLPSGPLKYPVSDMLPLFYRYRILDRQINSS